MKKWEVVNELSIKNHELRIEDLILLLLKNRGIKTEKEIKEFLNPDLGKINFSSVGIDKKELLKTKKRIKTAIDNKEKVIVYGDYDVDGITGCAILWEVLDSLGTDVLPYIPHRIDEGYGLSIKGIDNLLEKNPDVKLIITVDNGIVANEAVNYANSLGINVVITDHHTLGKKLPDAFSIVHSVDVCGSAVAYLLAKEIGEVNDEHLALVALATVADVMKLTGFNRVLLVNGLKALNKTKRFGLLELIKISQLKKDEIGVYEIGHVLAPRLNAMGRLESAMESLRLICTRNQKRAEELAMLLNGVNQERQRITFESVELAKKSVDIKKLKNLIFITNDKFEPGVIGLISGRLTEEFYRPSIIVSIKGEFSKASSRSVHGFNIVEFIRESSELLVDVGGHPMAAGFTVLTKDLKKIEEKINKLSEKIDKNLFDRKLKIDLEIQFSDINQNLFENISRLSPFGYGNPEPVFLTSGLVLEDLRIVGKDGKHLKLKIKSANPKIILDGILFGYDQSLNLGVGDLVDVVYSISENEWNGNKKLELKIKDIRKK